MAVAEPTIGEIRRDAAYPLANFQRITGLGAKAVRQARRKGLRVIRVGRRSFIQGADWLDYLEALANAATDK